jgi:hypothetical protein
MRSGHPVLRTAPFLVFVAGILMTLVGSAAAKTPHRLPATYHWGRCLLVVDDKTLISGKCAYQISKGGGFQINGPRQVYEGIDYPVSQIMAGKISTDYWAEVDKDGGTWTGYGNQFIGSVHGDRDFGVLRRKGACLVSSNARICLWRN